MKPAGQIQLVAHTPAHLRALIEGGEFYTRLCAIPVADGVREFLTGPEVSEAFRKHLRVDRAGDFWRDGFGVVLLSEPRLIGLCSFNGPPDVDGAVEISYGIAPGYEGRGYATEAAKLLLARAFAEPGVHRIRAHTLPEVNASTRVLAKCGFWKAGELIDPVDGPVWRWEIEPAAGSSRSAGSNLA